MKFTLPWQGKSPRKSIPRLSLEEKYQVDIYVYAVSSSELLFLDAQVSRAIIAGIPPSPLHSCIHRQLATARTNTLLFRRVKRDRTYPHRVRTKRWPEGPRYSGRRFLSLLSQRGELPSPLPENGPLLWSSSLLIALFPSMDDSVSDPKSGQLIGFLQSLCHSDFVRTSFSSCCFACFTKIIVLQTSKRAE